MRKLKLSDRIQHFSHYTARLQTHLEKGGQPSCVYRSVLYAEILTWWFGENQCLENSCCVLNTSQTCLFVRLFYYLMHGLWGSCHYVQMTQEKAEEKRHFRNIFYPSKHTLLSRKRLFLASVNCWLKLCGQCMWGIAPCLPSLAQACWHASALSGQPYKILCLLYFSSAHDNSIQASEYFS